MRLEIARQISDAADARSLPVELILTYSGRGMMGESTAALSTDSLGSFAAAVAMAANMTHDPVAFSEAMNGIRTDSLGKGIVIY